MKKIERLPACAPTPGVYFDIPELCTVKRTDLDRLEAENQEMLEALKAICIEVETSDESDISDYAYVKAVNLIGKVSGKTWEQIKKG